MPKKNTNLVNATKAAMEPQIGKGMRSKLKIAQSKKLKSTNRKLNRKLNRQKQTFSAQVAKSPEEDRQEIIKSSLENNGIPGFFQETIDKVLEKEPGLIVGSRSGNKPLTGSGHGFVRADAPKPMSMKQKSWVLPPLKGRLGCKRRFMRPCNDPTDKDPGKYNAMRENTLEHREIPHTISLQEIFMGVKNGDYDPKAMRLDDEGYLYFKNAPGLEVQNLEGVDYNNVEYRVNVRAVKKSDITIAGEDKFSGKEQFKSDSKSVLLEGRGDQKDKIEALMIKY